MKKTQGEIETTVGGTLNYYFLLFRDGTYAAARKVGKVLHLL
jgi:hypothetical protein